MAITKVSVNNTAAEFGDSLTVSVTFKSTKKATHYWLTLYLFDQDGNEVIVPYAGRNVGVSWGAYEVKKSIAASTTYTISKTITLDEGIFASALAEAGYSTSYKFHFGLNFYTYNGDTPANDFYYKWGTIDNGVCLFYQTIPDPSVTTVTLTETNQKVTYNNTQYTHLAYFSGYVNTQTSLSCTANGVTFPDGVTLSTESLTIGTHTYSPVSGTPNTFNVGTLDYEAGTYAVTYSVTDNHGNTSIYNYGNITVLAYTQPSITSFIAKRCYYDTFDDVYIESDDGELVQLYGSGSVYQFATGYNAWNLSLSWGQVGTTPTSETLLSFDSSSPTYSFSNSDLLTIIRDNSHMVDGSYDYYFAITLTDIFGNVAGPQESDPAITKSGAYFDIEKNGVAVGMMSTADSEHKKFEVANDYVSYFNGGINGVTNYSATEVDTGGKWVDGNTTYPIYRKTFKGSIGSTGWTIIGTTGHTPEIVFRIYGGVYFSLTGYFYPIPHNSFPVYVYSSNVATPSQVGSVAINVGSGFDLSGSNYIDYTFTVEYAGSTAIT